MWKRWDIHKWRKQWPTLPCSHQKSNSNILKLSMGWIVSNLNNPLLFHTWGKPQLTYLFTLGATLPISPDVFASLPCLAIGFSKKRRIPDVDLCPPPWVVVAAFSRQSNNAQYPTRASGNFLKQNYRKFFRKNNISLNIQSHHKPQGKSALGPGLMILRVNPHWVHCRCCIDIQVSLYKKMSSKTTKMIFFLSHFCINYRHHFLPQHHKNIFNNSFFSWL